MEHRPVLVAEVLDFLATVDDGVLLDGTLGLGGHAAAFLERHPQARLIGIDRDGDTLGTAQENLKGYGTRATTAHAAFADLESVLDDLAVDRVDGVLFDFGVSSPQLDRPERGFSFREDGPLDMRMDQSTGESAADLVARLPERELGNLLYELGGERGSRRIAAAIVAERRREPIRTTARLASIVRRAARGRSRIDPSTRTFQALRMAVNDEIGQIERGLEAAARRLRPGGRLVTIAFHSGEDRPVKNFLRADPRFTVLTKKVVKPGAAETRANRRARSARLRAGERNADA